MAVWFPHPDKILGRSKDGSYEPALEDSERVAVADLLQYLENVRHHIPSHWGADLPC